MNAFKKNEDVMLSSKSTKQHVVLLDFVRFLVALSVMIYHLCYWKNGHIPTEPFDTNNFWWFGWVGVQIFFILSGYVIAFSAQNSTPLSFAKSRFLRLIPTIWICASITLIAKLLLNDKLSEMDLFYAYLSTLFIYPMGIHIDVVYWTLVVECIFYLLVFIVLKFSTFSRLVPIMIFIGIYSSLYNFLVILMDLNCVNDLFPKFWLGLNKLHHMRTSRFLLLEHGVFFSVGVLVWYLNQSPSNKRVIQYLTFAFATICSLTIINAAKEYVMEHHAVGIYLLTPLMVFLTGFLLIYYAQTLGGIHFLRNHSVKIALRYLGLITFPLYLLHNDAGLLILSNLSRFLPDVIALIMTFVICIFTSIFVFMKIEPFAADFFKWLWDLFECRLFSSIKKA